MSNLGDELKEEFSLPEGYFTNRFGKLLILIKWIIVGVVVGLVVGGIGTAFYFGIQYVTQLRTEHDWLILTLPFVGLLIVFLYRLAHEYNDQGTNMVIDAIARDEHLPLRKAPLIFISTILTHLAGGSSGRESAALQLGGSIGFNLGRLFKFDKNNLKIITMCGMSAAFSSLFGTPMAAAFLAMEIESVGVMYYAAMVPCVLSALTADTLASYLGTEAEAFKVQVIPSFNLEHVTYAAILAVLCALVSVLFCVCMHKCSYLYKKFLKNPYLRIFVGGCIVAALTYISGTRIYNGAGMPVIEEATKGNVPYLAFLLKIIFTALTLGAGYKGGEIVPALFIGASFGSTFSQIVGFNPMLCAAVGMGALFCGVTNSPISSLLLCFELFGYNGMPYYLIAIALSYTFSGYYSVYSSQTIVYSKYENKYVNHKTR